MKIQPFYGHQKILLNGKLKKSKCLPKLTTSKIFISFVGLIVAKRLPEELIEIPETSFK
jgi:hypothetical protein